MHIAYIVSVFLSPFAC